MAHSRTSSLSSSLASSSPRSSLSLEFEPSRRQSKGFASAGIAMSRTSSASSYLSDDDLLFADTQTPQPEDCVAPSYHSTEDAYKQRKAAQMMLKKQYGGGCVVGDEKKSGMSVEKK